MENKELETIIDNAIEKYKYPKHFENYIEKIINEMIKNNFVNEYRKLQAKHILNELILDYRAEKLINKYEPIINVLTHEQIINILIEIKNTHIDSITYIKHVFDNKNLDLIDIIIIVLLIVNKNNVNY